MGFGILWKIYLITTISLQIQPAFQQNTNDSEIESDISLGVESGSVNSAKNPVRGLNIFNPVGQSPGATTAAAAPKQMYPTNIGKFFSEALKASNNGSIVELLSYARTTNTTELYGGRKAEIGEGVYVPATGTQEQMLCVPLAVTELYLFDLNLRPPKRFVITLDLERTITLEDRGRITPNNQNNVVKKFQKTLLNPLKLSKLASDYRVNPTAFYQKYLPMFFPATVTLRGYFLLDAGTDVSPSDPGRKRLLTLYNEHAKDFPPRNETYFSNFPVFGTGETKLVTAIISGTRKLMPNRFTEPYIKEEVPNEKGIKIRSDENTNADVTVTYRTVKTYEFIPDKSVGSEDDLVTIVNIPLLTFGKILGEVPYVGPNYFKNIIKAGEKLTRRNERVGDVFYYGFKAEPYIKVLESLEEAIPEQFAGGRFGLFKGRNGTDIGSYQVETGHSSSNSSSNYGRIQNWKDYTELPWWSGTCNSISGSEGPAFDPNSLGKFNIYTFDPDACRSLQYGYHGKAKFEGISGWKYVFDKNMLADPRDVEAGRCFCTKPGDDFEGCYKRGIIDLGPCRNGAPLALSYPHFYDADKEYLENVGGLVPDKALHESFILIEPKTGTVLQDVKRFQLNIKIKRTPSLAYLKNAPNRLLPVIWSEKTYSLDTTGLEVLKEELKKHVLDNDDDVDSEDGGWNQLKAGTGTDSAHGGNPTKPKPNSASILNIGIFTSLISVILAVLL